MFIRWCALCAFKNFKSIKKTKVSLCSKDFQEILIRRVLSLKRRPEFFIYILILICENMEKYKSLLKLLYNTIYRSFSEHRSSAIRLRGKMYIYLRENTSFLHSQVILGRYRERTIAVASIFSITRQRRERGRI